MSGKNKNLKQKISNKRYAMGPPVGYCSFRRRSVIWCGVAQCLAIRLYSCRGPRVLFFGGDDVSRIALQTLHTSLDSFSAKHGNCGYALHVVAPTAPTDRKALFSHAKQFPIPRYCIEKNVPLTVIDHPRSLSKSANFSLEKIIEETKSVVSPHHNGAADSTRCNELYFDVAVVVSFRYFLPNALLERLPPTINLHPSLLPKYRGASPIFSTILHGDGEGGYSIIKIKPRELMDSGDIILQEKIEISAHDDMRWYFPTVTRKGSEGLCKVLFGDGIDEGKRCFRSLEDWREALQAKLDSAIPQPNKTLHFTNDPFHAPLLDKHRAALKFDIMTGDECHNTWRAFSMGISRRLHANAVLDKKATPICEQQLEREVSKCERACHLIESQSHRELENGVGSSEASVAKQPSMFLPAKLLDHLKVPIVFVEAVHPSIVGELVWDEISKLEYEAATGVVQCEAMGKSGGECPYQLSPGTGYFPVADKNLCAVKCRDGWFFWTKGQLKHSTPQSALLIRQGLAMKQGRLYPHLFANSPQ